MNLQHEITELQSNDALKATFNNLPLLDLYFLRPKTSMYCTYFLRRQPAAVSSDSGKDSVLLRTD